MLIQLGLHKGSLSSLKTPFLKPLPRKPVESACGNALAMPTGKVFGYAPAFTHPHVGVSLPLNDTVEPCPSVTPTNRVRFSPADKPDASLSGKWGPVFLGWHWLHCWGRTVFLHGKPKRLAKWQSARCSPAVPITSANQALHIPDDERRPQPGGHIRLQAGVAKVRQQVAAAGQKIHQLRRPPRRLPNAELAALPPGRPEWSARLRLFSECPPARRQAGGAQGVPRRQPCARLGAGCHEHRQHVHRAAVPRAWSVYGLGTKTSLPGYGDARQTRRPDLRPQTGPPASCPQHFRARCSGQAATRSST